MKKILLGLGTLSLAALPVMAVVSCGGTENVETVDLNITIWKNKVVTQKMIDDAITIINVNSQIENNKLTALSTIFDGVTADNLKNFSVKATATAGEVAGTIVLTANKGFAFGTATTLTSKVVTLDLKITSKFVSQTVIDDAITAYTAATTDALKVTALSTVFVGMTEDNFNNFEVKAATTSGTTPGTIVLTAKDGFTFGTATTLSSKVMVDLKITNKASLSWDTINQALTNINSATTDDAILTALSTVFDGITPENFKNFEVKTTASAGSILGKIILTAKDGFSFAGEATLTSKEGTPVIINNN